MEVCRLLTVIGLDAIATVLVDLERGDLLFQQFLIDGLAHFEAATSFGLPVDCVGMGALVCWVLSEDGRGSGGNWRLLLVRIFCIFALLKVVLLDLLCGLEGLQLAFGR